MTDATIRQIVIIPFFLFYRNAEWVFTETTGGFASQRNNQSITGKSQSHQVDTNFNQEKRCQYVYQFQFLTLYTLTSHLHLTYVARVNAKTKKKCNQHVIPLFGLRKETERIVLPSQASRPLAEEIEFRFVHYNKCADCH